MNRIIIAVFIALTALVARAGEGENYINVNAGIMYPNTLNANIGFEHEFNYGHALEIQADAGNHWQHPTCHAFWKGYYWDGAALYKYRIARFKNSFLRIRGGVEVGAVRRKFFLGAELGLEFNYVFPSGIQLSLIQKNTVSFFNGDTFRDGVLIGLKFPLK